MFSVRQQCQLNLEVDCSRYVAEAKARLLNAVLRFLTRSRFPLLDLRALTGACFEWHQFGQIRRYVRRDCLERQQSDLECIDLIVLTLYPLIDCQISKIFTNYVSAIFIFCSPLLFNDIHMNETRSGREYMCCKIDSVILAYLCLICRLLTVVFCSTLVPTVGIYGTFSTHWLWYVPCLPSSACKLTQETTLICPLLNPRDKYEVHSHWTALKQGQRKWIIIVQVTSSWKLLSLLAPQFPHFNPFIFIQLDFCTFKHA